MDLHLPALTWRLMQNTLYQLYFSFREGVKLQINTNCQHSLFQKAKKKKRSMDQRVRITWNSRS